MTLRRKILIIISAMCLIFSIACWIELIFDRHYDNDVQYMFMIISPCLIFFSSLFFFKQVFKSEMGLVLSVIISMIVFKTTAESISKDDDILKNASDYYLEVAIIYDIEERLQTRDLLRFKSVFSNETGSADYYSYPECKIGDTIITRMSYNPQGNLIYRIIENTHPSHEEIQKYLEPVLYINKVEQPIEQDEYYIYWKKKAKEKTEKKKRKEQIKEAEIKQRYKQIGYIFKKDSRGITKQFNTMVYFGKEKAKQWKLERSMFENINVGDTLLLEFSDENEDYCKVISWHPTPEEKELYRTQVQKGNDITTPTTTE